jgi:hypothetical protein
MPISLWSSASAKKTATVASPGIQTWTADTAPVDTPRPKPQAKPKPVADIKPAPQKSQSLFSKAKTAVVDTAKSIRDTGERAANTGLAAGYGTVGVVKAVAKQATGDKQGAKQEVAKTNKQVDNLLDSGIGGKGGYISSKDAGGSSPKAVIKGITKGTAEIAPLVVPVGNAAKGASLFTKVVRGAAENAAVGGASTAASEVADGHVNAKDVLKSAATAGAIGGIVPVAGAGFSKLKGKGKTATPELPAAATATHSTPQPGDVIKPTPMEPTPVHAKVAEDITHRAHIENPVVQQKMQNVAKNVEGTYKPNPVPDAHKTLTKAVTEHNGAVGDVPTVGGTLIVKDHSPAGIDKAVKGIKEQYPSAEKVPSDIPGETKVQFTTESGHTGEITVSSPELAQAKKLQADMVKNTAESGPAHTAAAEEQAGTLYKNANEVADARLKQEQAIASEKSTKPEAVSPAKAPETPPAKATGKDGVSSPKPSKEPVKHTPFHSRVYERLQAEHPDELKGDLSYEAISLKQQTEKAVKLMETDKQQAYRIATGQEVSPDLTATSANIALSQKALEEGNHTLYESLVRNRSLAQTRRGQEIVSEKGSISDNSTDRYVKELLGARLDKLGKEHTMGISLKKTSAKETATKVIDSEVKKLDTQIKEKKLDVRTALSLLDKMECQ